MIVLHTALILLFAKASVAFNATEICANCEYNNGVGYVGSDDNCHVFFQCELKAGGWVTAKTMCCAPGTVWDAEHLTCFFGHCNDSYDPCPEKLTTTTYPCPFEPYEGNVTKYKVIQTWDIKDCPDGTVYSEEECNCVHGGKKTCRDDPLLYFPFAFDFNDIQCHKVQGTPHGDAELIEDEGYVRLDGDGDYVSFGFLANYFAWNKLEDFTVSIWFNQDLAGWDNLNNFPIEGLFGNGDCNDEASIWLTMGNETQQGGIRTNFDSALFENSGADQEARDYFPPEIWCQVAIRFSKNNVTLYLNGNVTATRDITGYVANSVAQSTMGLTVLLCDYFFWTGCIDDFMFFDRFVSDEEMRVNVFGRGRSGKGGDFPYVSSFYP